MMMANMRVETDDAAAYGYAAHEPAIGELFERIVDCCERNADAGQPCLPMKFRRHHVPVLSGEQDPGKSDALA